MAQLEQQARLQVTRRHTHRVERLHQCEDPVYVRLGPIPHRRDLVNRRHQVPVLIEVADDSRADTPRHLIVRLRR